MAKDNKDKNEAIHEPQSPKPQGSDNQKGKKGFLFGLLAFVTALIIMFAVIGGAFFIVIHNNINGIGERYRKEIQGIPLLSMALPKVADPDDPQYLTQDQIKEKYQEYRKKNDELAKQLDEANKKISELQKVKDEQDKIKAESDKIKKDAQEQKEQTDLKEKQLLDDKKKLDELIANGDKAGFKAYFEKIDKENAQKLYTEILEEQKADEDAVKFAKLYESMDAGAAASIFEQLGDEKIDLVVDTLRYMKKEASAAVMAAMTPDYAAKITERLSKYYLATPKPN